MSADAQSYGERFLDGGTEDPGRGRGISCRKFLSFEGFEPALKQRESECTSRGTNLLLPRRVRLPQCSLVLGAAFAHLIPTLSPGWKMEIPGFRTRLILDSLMRDGSVQDLDLGFLRAVIARLRRAPRRPSPAPCRREDREIGESAWRLWRVSLCWGSTLDTCRFLGCRQSVWVKILVRLII